MLNIETNFEELSIMEALSKREREYQTALITKLFELWALTYKQQAVMLGLSPNTQTSIHRYKTGTQTLPLYRDIQDRIKNLLAIHQYLRRAYSFDKTLAYQWITTPNADFNFVSPYEFIEKTGYMGLLKVREYLAQTQQ